jgi:hypothetical protein
MQRRRFEQIQSLEERLAEEANAFAKKPNYFHLVRYAMSWSARRGGPKPAPT